MVQKNILVASQIACAIAISLCFLDNTAIAEDKCSDILAQGIRDEYNLTSTSSIEEATYNAVCKKGYDNRTNSSGFAINIPVPELNGILGLGTNDSRSSQKRNEFCSDASSSINHNSSVNFAKKLINKKVVDAWSACMSSKGLYCEAENINDTHFVLKVSWNPSLVAEDPKIESDLVVIGGDCKNPTMLKSGNIIRQHASVTEACKRHSDNSNGQIFAFLNTTQGSLNCVVPKLVKPLDSNEYLQACINGNYEGCAGLQAQAKKKRQACLDVAGPIPTDLTPNEAQERAIMERSCGNIEANAEGVMALIENVWQDCNHYGSNSEQCNDAKRNLSIILI